MALIEPVELTEEGLRQLQAAQESPDTAWYYRRRRAALAAAGVLGAGSWNPNLHPRGPDGRFITTFGFVRWLNAASDWSSGQVMSIDPGNGDIHVRRTGTNEDLLFSKFEASKQLYSRPKPKATLKLPDPKAGKDAPGFKKIGGQGGSNPGGLYEVDNSSAVVGKNGIDTSSGIVTLMTVSEPDEINVLGSTDETKKKLSDLKDGWAAVNMTTGQVLTGSDGTVGGVFDETTGNLVDDADSLIVDGENWMVSDGHDLEWTIQFRSMLNNMVGQKPTDTEKFYVKTAKSEDHAKNEMLANLLYETGGVAVPDVSIGDDGVTVASKIVAGDTVESLGANLTPEVIGKLQEDFVFDAWLSNWDVIGLSLDNVLVVDGVPFRVDAGGALKYRAMGSPKGELFGDKVGELDTLTNASVNPQSAKIFGGITNAKLKEGAKRLAAIKPYHIQQLVKEVGLDDSMSDRLIARRKYILDKLDVDGDVTVPEAVSAPEPILPDVVPGTDIPVDLTGHVWNPSTKKFEPGVYMPVLAVETERDKFAASLTSTFTRDDIAAMDPDYDYPVVWEDDKLWFVQAVPGGDGSDVEFEHVATGAKKTRPVPAGEVLHGAWGADSADGTTEGFAEAYVNIFEKQQIATATLYSSVYTEQELLDVTESDPRLTLKQWDGASVSDLEAGEWLRDSYFKDFVKVVGPDPDAPTEKFIVQNLAGDQFTATLAKSKTRFAKTGPGSLLPAVLDAMEAREKVAAYNATTDVPEAKMTPTDATMSTIATTPDPAPEPIIPDVAPAADNAEFAKSVIDDLVSETPKAPAPLPDDFDPTKSFTDPATTYSKNIIVVQEAPDIAAMTEEEKKALIGKAVYERSTSTYDKVKDKGVYVVEGFTGMYVKTRDAVGHEHTIENSHVAAIVEKPAPILQYQMKKPGSDTTSGNHDSSAIVVNGIQVGRAEKIKPHYWSYPEWKVTIFPEFSVSGDTITETLSAKGSVKSWVIPKLVMPDVTGTKKKSDATKSLEKVVTAIEFDEPLKTTPDGTALTLLDGTPATPGTWVISKTDGSRGKIISALKGNGFIKVEMEDGSIKGRQASALSASFDPEGAAPSPSPVYANVKLSDGTQPLPGQRVSAAGGKLHTIIQIKEDGSVRIDDGAGKRTWTSAEKLTPDASQPKVVPTVAEAMATLPAFKATTPKSQKAAYPAPDGTTIPQNSDALATWRKYAPTRNLTRDGFVPQVGMRVRDVKGEQGVIVRIGDTTSSNPSALWIQSTEFGDVKVRTSTRVWVDHAAELSDPSGNPLPKVSLISFPDIDKSVTVESGSVVYSSSIWSTTYGRSVKLTQYYVAGNDGKLYEVTKTGGLSEVGKNKYAPSWTDIVGNPEFKKIAYVDTTSDSVISLEVYDTGSYSSGTVFGSSYVHLNQDGELEKLKHEIVQSKLSAGLVVADEFEGTNDHLPTLPKPSTALTAAPVAPKSVPIAKGDASKLKGTPAVAGSYTIESGLAKLKERANLDEAGAHTVYAMTDSDTIEDMAVRLQLAVDENGDEYVEIRYHLLEEHVDDLAERLIIAESDSKGAWVRKDFASVGDLKDGDALSVRISSKKFLKPTEGEPNVRVVGTPEKVGVSDSGKPAYRITVATSGGSISTMVVEDRGTPSIARYEFDPTKVTYSKKFTGIVSPVASSAGWSIRNNHIVSYEQASTSGSTTFDSKGRKIIETSSKATGNTNIKGHTGAYRMQLEHPGGGKLTVQMTHPASEKRGESGASYSAIRASVNGEVMIKVRADDPLALEKISDMMAASGVHPDDQGQPSADSLVKLSMNKLHRQYNSTYSHLKQSGVTGADDTGGIEKVLGMVKSAAGSNLPRNVTLDDIRLKADVDGRMKVVLSNEVAKAIADRAGFTGAYHSWTGSGWKPDIFTSRAGVGVMSTDERWSTGIFKGGMSSTTDVTNDSGNRVYLRLTKQHGSISGGGRMFISPMTITKNVDWYWNSGDRFGTRSSSNLSWLNSGSYGSSNEIMMKRKITPDMVGFIIFGDNSARKKAIEDLKKGGVTMIGGRPVEDVLIVSGGASMSQLEPMLPDTTGEIPLTSIISGTPGVPAPAPGALP